MSEFQKIDWKTYNRPPFYQQWLCRDDTLKLATFGDRGLAEFDDQILALKDQWDLDNVKGHFLDRIGKLLNDSRNGNTDEYYRILLKLRRLLNTNNGSIPSIIKAIKFIYSSEVVHIVPNYPAGLIIEHDGEGTPGLNFNKLLAEIIPAGVSFSTKELFDFFDELTSADSQLIQVHHIPKEEFEGRIYHNRRILRDGHTILATELKKAYHNGVNYHNGITGHNGQYEAEATSYIRLPLRRESGYLEVLNINQGLNFKDFQFSRLFHNGTIKRKMRASHNGEFPHDGSTNRMIISRHNGRSELSISDYMSAFLMGMNIAENFPSGEDFLVSMTVFDKEEFRKPDRRNGNFARNGVMYHTGRPFDTLSMVESLALQDNAKGNLNHNNSITRDGTETRSKSGNEPLYETHKIGIKDSFSETVVMDESQSLYFGHTQEDIFTRNYRRNNTIMRNGTIYRYGGVNDKNVCHVNIAPMLDKQIGNLNHNKSIRRNGSEEHRGTRAAYDRLYAGIRYHHYHNGVYKRNNGIKQNTGVLIPLDIS